MVPEVVVAPLDISSRLHYTRKNGKSVRMRKTADRYVVVFGDHLCYLGGDPDLL